MALRKKAEHQTKAITVNAPKGSDLQLRLEKLSKRTGLSCFDMLQKWVLQEEFMIALMQRGNKPPAAQTKTASKVAPKKTKTSGVEEQGKASSTDKKSSPKNAAYRKSLAAKIKKLKKEGTTLKKIAEIFNNEKVPTVSGSGKWYTSSISWLLKSVKED